MLAKKFNFLLRIAYYGGIIIQSKNFGIKVKEIRDGKVLWNGWISW